MLKTNVLDMSGKVVGEIELSEAVFGSRYMGVGNRPRDAFSKCFIIKFSLSIR